jgi:hypothetical protein
MYGSDSLLQHLPTRPRSTLATNLLMTIMSEFSDLKQLGPSDQPLRGGICSGARQEVFESFFKNCFQCISRILPRTWRRWRWRRQKADVNVAGMVNGFTPLFAACENNDLVREGDGKERERQWQGQKQNERAHSNRQNQI